MIESLTGAAWVWTMKTSQPRMEMSYRQWISPLANSRRLASPSSTPRCAGDVLGQRGVGAARDQLESPAGDQLHGSTLLRPGARRLGPARPPGARGRRRSTPSAPRHDRMRGIDCARRPPRRPARGREGADPCARRRCSARLHDALAHHRARADDGVGQDGVGADLGPRPDPQAPRRITPGQQRHVARRARPRRRRRSARDPTWSRPGASSAR